MFAGLKQDGQRSPPAKCLTPWSTYCVQAANTRRCRVRVLAVPAPFTTHTANNAIAFLRSSIQNLGSHKRVGLLRADSSLCDNALLEHLEQSKTAYTTAMG